MIPTRSREETPATDGLVACSGWQRQLAAGIPSADSVAVRSFAGEATYQTELVAENDLKSGEPPGVQFPFRAVASPELIDKVTGVYELDWTGDSIDVGGGVNLNLALSGTDGPAY